MKNFLPVILILVSIFLTGVESFGQVVTYTTDGNGGWVRSPETGGCSSVLNHPTMATISGTEPTFNNQNPPVMTNAGCKIVLVINHDITLTGLTIGSNVEIVVNSSGTLNLTGDINISGSTAHNSIIVNGGVLNLSGNLEMDNGGQTNKTKLLVDIGNGGSFKIDGELNLGNDAQIEIDGDGEIESSLLVGALNIAQRAKVDILTGGGLIVEGDVDYRGNHSSINVYGFFRTEGSLLITGGAGNQLNAYGSAQVIIERNLDVRGTSDITFGGNSETDIGGDILISGNSKVIATENAIVYVCGNFPEPCDGQNCSTQELIEGEFSSSCRILPVDFISMEATYLKQNRSTIVKWSTAKEWENSHFEIQRSLDGISKFDRVAEVVGMGYKDSPTDYKFEDNDLPLREGLIYYRLKQVDISGGYTYSSVFAIQITGIEYSKGVWRAYPNPTSGNQLRIGLLDQGQYRGEALTFRLIHPTLKGMSYSVASENEMNEILAALIPGAPKGVLVVEIQWGQKVEHIKVLKK